MRYVGLFGAIFVFGTPVLLPTLHLGLVGELNVAAVAFVAMGVMLASDSLWYALGRSTSLEQVSRLPLVRRHAGAVRRLQGCFDHIGTKLLLLSRLLYGFKISINLLCGAARMGFSTFLLVDLVASAIWLAALLALVWGVGAGLEVAEAAHSLHLSVALMIAVAFVLHLCLGRFARRRVATAAVAARQREEMRP